MQGHFYAIYEHEDPPNDELFNHFMNKRIPEFWKRWSSKFHQNLAKDVYIDDSNNETVVSNAFADHFSSIYSASYNNLDAKRDFDVLCASIADDNFNKADLISIVNPLNAK